MAMFKKRFLPYYKNDATTSPLNLESNKPQDELLELVRGQDQQQQQVIQTPPAAHQSSNRIPPAVLEHPDPQWTSVPVHQMIPHNTLQTNPINHMHQQQMMFDMDIYKRQCMYETEFRQNTFPAMTHMYSMGRTQMNPTSAPVYNQEMEYYDAMQRYQHERYLQQARDMQMADLRAEEEEKFNRMVVEREMTRDLDRGKVKEEAVDKKKMARRNSFRAVMKNGELVEAEDGYLMVTHNNMVVNNLQSSMDMSCISTIGDSPLNLSMKDQITTQPHHSDTDSGYNPSPLPGHDTNTAMNLVANVPSMQGMTKTKAMGVTILLHPAPGTTKVTKLLPRIAPKPPTEDLSPVQLLEEDIKDPPKDTLVVVAPSPSPSSPNPLTDMKTLFPHLKMTNTGSLVLWNFLWALLQDDRHRKIVTWISFPNLKFNIVNPTLLATMWGQVKQNPSMDWVKINKILDLYLRKNLISSGPTELMFTFLIIPKSVRESLSSESQK